MVFGRNVDEENSRTNAESESSVEQWGIEMRDRASMTDDLNSVAGPTNSLKDDDHTHHRHHHHQHRRHQGHHNVVSNGQATMIGRRPSIRANMKVTPDIRGAPFIHVTQVTTYMAGDQSDRRLRFCSIHLRVLSPWQMPNVLDLEAAKETRQSQYKSRV